MATSVSWRDIREGGLRLDEVESALGINAKEIGDEDWALCPLPDHSGDRSDAHFSINRETYMWNCFTCGGGGALPLLVQRCLEVDKASALNWLCQFSDVNPGAPVEQWVRKFRGMASRTRTETFTRPPTLPWMPERLIADYEAAMPANAATWIQGKWGIYQEVAEEFRLGFAYDYEHKARLRGHAIIIPHFWKGKLVGWQARWMDEDKVAILFGESKKVPKYVNTDDFPKQYTLYNWDNVAGSRDPLLVVESFATVMKLHMYGYQAVATFGASISREQENILATYSGPLFLAYDNDPAGQGAQRGLSAALRRRGSVWMVPPPDGEKADMGDLTKPEIDALLAQAKPAFLATSGT